MFPLFALPTTHQGVATALAECRADGCPGCNVCDYVGAEAPALPGRGWAIIARTDRGEIRVAAPDGSIAFNGRADDFSAVDVRERYLRAVRARLGDRTWGPRVRLPDGTVGVLERRDLFDMGRRLRVVGRGLVDAHECALLLGEDA